MSIPQARQRGPFGLAGQVKNFQDRLAGLWGRPTSGMRTSFHVGLLPVIFLHNPKTGRNSLRKVLEVKRISHSFASRRLSEKNWLATYSIVVVREPMERFLSGYYSHILRPDVNGLVKIYGEDIKNITPEEYLEVLHQNPKYGGHQTLWTDYPSTIKPRANLVLRLEEVGLWHDQLSFAGIDLRNVRIEHLNKSERAGSDHQTRLGLTRTQYNRLCEEVRNYFHSDYVAFGYN